MENERKPDWWRINPSKRATRDIEYDPINGMVRARIIGGSWVFEKVYNARDAEIRGHILADKQMALKIE